MVNFYKTLIHMLCTWLRLTLEWYYSYSLQAIIFPNTIATGTFYAASETRIAVSYDVLNVVH